ncbi:hypothetical protein ACROYT_G015306 [Oculina patagonica]
MDALFIFGDNLDATLAALEDVEGVQEEFSVAVSNVTKKVFGEQENVTIHSAFYGTQLSPEPSTTSTNEPTTSSSSGSECVSNQPGSRPSETSINEPTTSSVSGSGRAVDQPGTCARYQPQRFQLFEKDDNRAYIQTINAL